MAEIRKDLEARSGDLKKGIAELDRSLERLTKTGEWVVNIRKVLGILEDVFTSL